MDIEKAKQELFTASTDIVVLEERVNELKQRARTLRNYLSGYQDAQVAGQSSEAPPVSDE